MRPTEKPSPRPMAQGLPRPMAKSKLNGDVQTRPKVRSAPLSGPPRRVQRRRVDAARLACARSLHCPIIGGLPTFELDDGRPWQRAPRRWSRARRGTTVWPGFQPARLFLGSVPPDERAAAAGTGACSALVHHGGGRTFASLALCAARLLGLDRCATVVAINGAGSSLPLQRAAG